MHDAVLAKLAVATVVIKAAAVADYRPTQHGESRKLKKDQAVREMALEPTPDILAELGRRRGTGSWSGSPPRPTTSSPTPERSSSERTSI